ncbi:TPA: type 2 lanthipeptide synthetase LanM family protein [Enterococcus faecium]
MIDSDLKVFFPEEYLSEFQLYINYSQKELNEYLEHFEKKLSRLDEYSPELFFVEQLFVEIALDKIKNQLLGITEQAVASIENHLKNSINRIVLRTMIYDYNFIKKTYCPDLSNILEYNKIYSAEYKDINFFSKYPGLLKVIVHEHNRLTENICLLLQRIEEDRPLFYKLGIKEVEVMDLKFNQGDLHDGGQSTCIVYFKEDQLVYKPRNPFSDQILNNILSLYNEQEYHQLKITKLINRTTYYWSEFIPQTNLERKEDASVFYYKMGVLFSVIYALNGKDIHFQNIIACNTDPVIIDSECLMTSDLLDSPHAPSSGLINSILNTHCVPTLSNQGMGNIVAAINNQLPVDYFKRGTMKKLENGYLKYFMSSTEAKTQNHPLFKNEKVLAKEYIKDILAGFTSGYNFCIENRQNLLERIQQNITENSSVRILFNSTGNYANLLALSYHPKLLLDTESREKFILNTFKTNYSNHVARNDYQELQHGDIPYWTWHPLQKSTAGKNTGIHFDRSPYMSVKTKLAKLCSRDLELQKKLINVSIQSLFHDLSIRKLAGSNEPQDLQGNGIEIERQIDLYLALMMEQFNSGAGYNITFIENKSFMKKLNHSLYSGWIGIGILAMSRYTYTNDETLIKFADAIVESYAIRESEKFLEGGIGVFSGISSVIYLCEVCYEITEDQKYLALAKRNLEAIYHRITDTTPIDIIEGLSGISLVCFNLYELTKDAFFFDYGEAILSNIYGQLHWDALISGYSHGIAGIVVAFQYYTKLSGSSKYEVFIANGLESENKYRHRWGWKDKRKNGSIEDFGTWCHGAPGILLSRYLLKKYGSSINLDKDFSIARSRLEKDSLINLNLCHGLLGNDLIAYFTTTVTGERDQIITKMNRYCISAVKTIDIETRVADFSVDLGLMTGITGIYYAYLYINQPEKIPFVLSLSS